MGSASESATEMVLAVYSWANGTGLVVGSASQPPAIVSINEVEVDMIGSEYEVAYAPEELVRAGASSPQSKSQLGA